MLNFYRFSDDLINAARKATNVKEFQSITPNKYNLAYTDAIVPACRGHQAISLLATDEKGLIPNWHWTTDTLINIDFDTPQLASDFSLEMIKNLYETLKQKLEKNKQDMKQFQEELKNSEEL